MTSRDRFTAALRCEQPDRVPYCELGIDRALAQKLMDWGAPLDQTSNLEANTYTLDESKAIAAKLGTDNICCVIRAPVYAEKHPGADGRLFYGDGLIHSKKDLTGLSLPDPTEEGLNADAVTFTQQKEDYAAWFVTRVGIFPTLLSLGVERFSIALYDDRDLVETVLDWYTDWMVEVAERVCRLNFDAFVSTDDMAFNTAPYFSPKVFRELVLPRYRRVAEKVSIPWIIHSDGNILPFLDDLMDLGIAGLHPLEKGAVDIRDIKTRYGDRLCLLGNVDLNLLGMGPPEDVRQEVRGLIRDVGPDGGYVVTCGNSLAGYLIPENVLALGNAVREFGEYPIEEGLGDRGSGGG